MIDISDAEIELALQIDIAVMLSLESDLPLESDISSLFTPFFK